MASVSGSYVSIDGYELIKKIDHTSRTKHVANFTVSRKALNCIRRHELKISKIASFWAEICQILNSFSNMYALLVNLLDQLTYLKKKYQWRS